MTALALALAEQPLPRSESSLRTVFVWPLTVVVTSALAVASDLQPPFWLLVELEELLDEDDEEALAEADTEVLSAAAVRISLLMLISPPIAPAAIIATQNGQPDCNLGITRTPFHKTNTRQRAAGNAGHPLAGVLAQARPSTTACASRLPERR
jgi:hypothetical protein